jgi:hypothetical protein
LLMLSLTTDARLAALAKSAGMVRCTQRGRASVELYICLPGQPHPRESYGMAHADAGMVQCRHRKAVWGPVSVAARVELGANQERCRNMGRADGTHDSRPVHSIHNMCGIHPYPARCSRQGACLPACLSECLPACLSACLPACLSV